MSDVMLGASPKSAMLRLVEGGDFLCTLKATDGTPWPGTAVIALEIGATTWTATIAGADATFNVDKVAVQAVINSGVKRFRLTYTDGGTDLVWAQGRLTVTPDA